MGSSGSVSFPPGDPKIPSPWSGPLRGSPSTPGLREDGALAAGPQSGACLDPGCVTLGESFALSEPQFLLL